MKWQIERPMNPKIIHTQINLIVYIPSYIHRLCKKIPGKSKHQNFFKKYSKIDENCVTTSKFHSQMSSHDFKHQIVKMEIRIFRTFNLLYCIWQLQ